MMDIVISSEEPADFDAIYDITKRAFAPMPFAGGDEQDLISALRKADALTISLVAKCGGKIIGHVAFSPAKAKDNSAGWYALGPVAVEPELQGKGAGSALIRAGIDLLQQRNARGCILTGNPDYYKRFGFRPYPEFCPDGEPPEYFQILALNNNEPGTIIEFHSLFHAE